MCVPWVQSLTQDSNVWTLLKGMFTYHKMYLMNTSFHFPHFIPMSVLIFDMKYPFLPPSLLSPSASFGDSLLRGQCTSPPLSTNTLPSGVDLTGVTEQSRIKMMHNSSSPRLSLGVILCTHMPTEVIPNMTYVASPMPTDHLLVGSTSDRVPTPAVLDSSTLRSNPVGDCGSSMPGGSHTMHETGGLTNHTLIL